LSSPNNETDRQDITEILLKEKVEDTNGDLATHTSISPILHGFAPVFVNYKKVAFDSQLQILKLTNFLPMVGGSLKVLPLHIA
jgi:hypothetical protein